MKFKRFLRKSSNFFSESLDYLIECRNFIWFSVILFFVGSMIGFFLSDYFTFLNEILREIVSMTEGLDAFNLVIFIFNNNVKSAFFGVVFGVILGVFPFFNAFFNGVVLGYVMNMVWAVSGFSNFWRLLPHGIFELPAIFIAFGMGIRLGVFFLSKEPKKELKYRFKNSLKVFVSVVIPLLVVAAIIEGLLIAFL